MRQTTRELIRPDRCVHNMNKKTENYLLTWLERGEAIEREREREREREKYGERCARIDLSLSTLGGTLRVCL